jgi:hypothetical protein
MTLLRIARDRGWRLRCAVSAFGLASLVGGGYLSAQSAPLRLKQLSEETTPQPLTAAEASTLGDPLFNLLLRDKADTTRLSAVQDAIQPDIAKRHLFVVSEDIVRKTQVGGRRAVLAFDGQIGPEALGGNVMLSVTFGPSGLLEATDIEAWGWDNHRERYNYYKLDLAGGSAGSRVWKFRGSSEGADLLAPNDRNGTCFRCHVVGAPVMKELLFPWNNWHAGVGGSFKAEYLDPISAETNKWPAAATLAFQRLSTADRLETAFLIPAFKRFDTARLNAVLKRDDTTGNRFVSPAGRMVVLEGQRLLRSLFQTVEVNLISSRNTSGAHPFGSAGDFVAGLDIQIPPSFFLNQTLIAGGGSTGFGGLQVTAANQFVQFAKLTQQENRDLLEKFKLKVNGVRGDTHFGWFVPEPAFVDNDIIDQAMKLGAITPHFVAAALAVDIETPVFSGRRSDLLGFVPNEFEFVPATTPPNPMAPRDASTDLLTQSVIARINQANPAAGSAADEFRTLLSTPNAVIELQNRVTSYANRVRTALGSPNPTRRAELERLYSLLVERRRLMSAHEVLRNLDETGGKLLLPLP